MEGLNAVIKSVCIISAAICLIEGLSAGTRFKNQVRFLLDLIFVTVIVTPVLKGSFEFEMPDIEQYLTIDYSESEGIYQEEIKRQTEENISSVLMQQLEAAGINCSSIETNINISETNSISISSVTVNADNFEAAAEVIRNSLGAETEVFDVNS